LKSQYPAGLWRGKFIFDRSNGEVAGVGSKRKSVAILKKREKSSKVAEKAKKERALQKGEKGSWLTFVAEGGSGPEDP